MVLMKLCSDIYYLPLQLCEVKPLAPLSDTMKQLFTRMTWKLGAHMDLGAYS